MTAKTRYEETPASELPKQLRPVKASERMPEKSGAFFFETRYFKGEGYFNHEKKTWVNNNTAEPIHGLIFWYEEVEPSEPQVVSRSLEDAARELLSENIIEYNNDLPNGFEIGPFSHREENVFIKSMLEFSQQQQQGQQVKDFNSDSIDVSEWIKKCIHGPSGYIVFEEREYPLHRVSREQSIAEFIVRCLGNNKNEGAKEICEALLSRHVEQPTQGNEVRELNDDEIYEMSKDVVAYDRQLAVCGKKEADGVLYFAIKGMEKYREYIRKHTTTSKEEGK